MKSIEEINQDLLDLINNKTLNITQKIEQCTILLNFLKQKPELYRYNENGQHLELTYKDPDEQGDSEERDCQGQLLVKAFQSSQWELVQLMLNAQADPFQHCELTSTSALEAMVAAGHLKGVKDLLDIKRFSTYRSVNGCTLLMTAAAMGPLAPSNSSNYNAIINILIQEVGLNIEFANNEGLTALDLAIQSAKFINELNMAATLLSYNAVIHNPQQLFDRIQTADPGDPNVFFCLNKLIEQLEPQAKTIETISLTAECIEYSTTLKTTTEEFSIFMLSLLTKNLSENFPHDILKIIADYDSPKERSTQGFFKPNKVSTLAAPSEEKEERELQAKCSTRCSLS